MSQRERLRARQLPTAQVAIPADPVGYAAAERDVETATRELQVARLQAVDDLTELRARFVAAQDALAGQPVEVFHMRCLPAAAWEDLVDLHPPTEEQRALHWQWNVPAFRPALLAASVVVPDGETGLTAHDWAQLAAEGQVAAGELELLFGTAVQLNARQPQVSTGKG